MIASRLTLAATLIAALALAACGDDTPDTVTTAPETAPPAMAAAPVEAPPPAMAAVPAAVEVAPPAMAAVPAAVEAPPPAMAAVPPNVNTLSTLTLDAIAGRWALAIPACANAADVMVITAAAFNRPAAACAINSATATTTGLDLAVACGTAPVETWTVTAASVAPPVTAIEVAMTGARVALVRCP